MNTLDVARIVAVYPSERGSELRADAVCHDGFDVRFEVEAGPARNNSAYEIILAVRNLSRFSAVRSVRPPRFSGTVDDGVHWFNQSNEFVFRVEAGSFGPDDILELIGSLRVGNGAGTFSTMRSAPFVVAPSY